jgi:hypothetical protein
MQWDWVGRTKLQILVDLIVPMQMHNKIQLFSARYFVNIIDVLEREFPLVTSAGYIPAATLSSRLS